MQEAITIAANGNVKIVNNIELFDATTDGSTKYDLQMLEYLLILKEDIPNNLNITDETHTAWNSETTVYLFVIKLGNVSLEFKDKKISKLYFKELIKVKCGEVQEISEMFPEANV